jgi:hypothetical protein
MTSVGKGSQEFLSERLSGLCFDEKEYFVSDFRWCDACFH